MSVQETLRSIATLEKQVKQLQSRNLSPQNGSTRVYNGTGSQVDAGKVVYISGVNSGAPSIAYADWTVAATHDSILGVLPYNIGSSDWGFVMRFGYVRDIDTSAWAAADELYLSTTGDLTNVAPATAIYIASAITIDATEGVIYVNWR